jgi:gas vesicle protein
VGIFGRGSHLPPPLTKQKLKANSYFKAKGERTMADQDNEFGAFLSGFIIGGLVGAAVSLLLAPQSGEETRTIIRDKSIELRDKATETAEEARTRAEKGLEDARARADQAVEDVRHRADELANLSKERASELRERSQVLLDEQKARIETAIEDAKTAAQKARTGKGENNEPDPGELPSEA